MVRTIFDFLCGSINLDFSIAYLKSAFLSTLDQIILAFPEEQQTAIGEFKIYFLDNYMKDGTPFGLQLADHYSEVVAARGNPDNTTNVSKTN